MRIKTIKYVMALLVGLLMTACSTDDGREDNRVQMPVHISIPIGDIGTTTRAPGDPGTYEQFKLPTHLWLYLVVTPEGETAMVEEVLTIDAIDEDMWTKEKLGSDSVYTYAGELSLQLPQTRYSTDVAEIYALLSADDLTINPTIAKGTSTKEQLLNMTFNLPGSDPQKYGEMARNIYSSPHQETNYYGTVKNFEGDMPYVENFVLYHVAAKLDVIWNVAEDKQADVKLSKMELLNLKKENCYAFKPLGNTAVGDNSYSESVTLDEGQQWYGRHSFYVIPYGTEFLATLKLYKQGNNTGKEINLNQDYKSAIYTPWVVVPLQINNDIP